MRQTPTRMVSCFACLAASFLRATLAALLLALTAPGCHGVRGSDEGWVAQELHERTGHHPAGTPLPGEPFVPDGVDCSDGLNEDECVALAVCNNAAYLEL